MEQTKNIDTKKLKYCIVTNEMDTGIGHGNMEAVGFYQWLNAFDGQIFEAKSILSALKDGDFDIIHVRLTPPNIPVIMSIRERIGEKSETKLVVSMDIPVRCWRKHSFRKDKVKEAIQMADFAFATEYTICTALEKLAGKPVYELPHPADLQKIRNYGVSNRHSSQEESMIINFIYPQRIKNLLWVKWYAKRFNIKLRMLYLKEQDKKYPGKLEKYGIEAVFCKDEADFCKALLEGSAFVAPYDYRNYGKPVIYAAALGIFAVGNILSDASRRCYPIFFTRKFSLRFYRKLVEMTCGNPEIREFICDNALYKAEYYNLYNLKNRFLKLIAEETCCTRFEEHIITNGKKIGLPVFMRDIRHLCGKNVFDLEKNEAAVVCYVKNGIEYLDSFINHYSNMGFKHMVFIDSYSTDGTLEALQNRDNVTVYLNSLPHKHYESEIRRTVIENLFRGSWCLCVDIDELFDYPCSDKVSLSQFLDYMNLYNYTAVAGYMLDMFSKDAGASDESENLTEKYRFYDITEIQKDGYYRHNPNLCNYNILSDKSFKYYYGGVRWKYFGREASKYILIKHPLVFVDRKIEPVTDPHFCNKAYVADVNCLLKHYKFIGTFKDRLSLDTDENQAYFARVEQREYSRLYENKEDVSFYSSAARELNNINELIQSEFLKVSGRYSNFVDKEAGRQCVSRAAGRNNSSSV